MAHCNNKSDLTPLSVNFVDGHFEMIKAQLNFFTSRNIASHIKH